MKKIFLIFITILFCSSCITLPWFNEKEDYIEKMKKNLTEAQVKTEASRQNLEMSKEEIKTSAQTIKKNTTEVKKGVPQETKTEIRQKLDAIQGNADKIVGETAKLEIVAKDLKTVGANLGKIEENSEEALKADEELLKKIKDLEDEKQTALRKAMNYLIMIAILVIAISAVGVFQGNIKAVGGIIGGVIVIVSALAVSILYVNLAWVGLIGIVGIVLIVAFEIYQAIKNKKEKEKAKEEASINEKTLEETVLTVEALKEKLPEETKKEFFGDGAYPGKVKHIQTPKTEAKVLDIRKKLKDTIEPTINR